MADVSTETDALGFVPGWVVSSLDVVEVFPPPPQAVNITNAHTCMSTATLDLIMQIPIFNTPFRNSGIMHE
jgi:hypothetical protein